MPKSSAAVVVFSAVFAFIVGLVLGRSIDRGEAELRDSAGASLVAPTTRRVEDEPERFPFQEIRDEEAPRATLVTSEDADDSFVFRRLNLSVDGDEPEACLVFSSPLDPNKVVAYRDYIKVSTEDRPALKVDGSSLCLSGIGFNTEIKATIRKGFPANDGQTLASSKTLTIAFGDKPPFVGFAGNGIILPRLEADGLAIETVNVDRLKLSVARVSDRAIVTKTLTSGGTIDEDQYYYVYGREDGEDVGAPVLDQTIDIAEDRNETVTTVYPIGNALKTLSPGAYFVRITDVSQETGPRRRKAEAWRWILYTDLAITTFSSSEGLTASIRSFQSGRPQPVVDVHLLAENNDILARATSDADGFVTFNKEAIAGKGPLRPAMLLAYGPQSDFASLDLRRAPLDLADYQVAGREAPPIVDGYLYTDRGIYRAGETVHISGLLRDSSGRAENRPSTLVLTRPNGVEATRFRIDDYNAGGFSRSFTLPTSSPRGSWRASLEADATGRAATLRFSVEDFVPQRLEVTLNADVDEPLLEGDPRSINLSSRFLYGAPAANLAVEAEARIRVDPNPFPDYKSYSFKRVGSPFQERLIPMIGVRGAPKDATTDENGNLSFDVSVPRQRNASSAPLRADIVVGVVEPGGRIVRDSIRIPYRDKERYVGLSLPDGKSSVGLNEEAIVEIVSIDRLGIAKETELEWSLVREDYQFEWYRQNGQWRWRRTSRDVQVGDGTIKTNLDGKAFVTRSLDPGAYRLTAYDTEAGSSADLQFYVGWRSYESGVDRPDKAAITVVSDEVTPGGKVRLVLDAPYAGEATVVVATDTVQSTQRVRVEEGPKELVIDTDEAWGAGFYLLTSVVTPRTPTDRPVPRRAMGITYVPFNMQSRTLDVSITTPELVRPNTNLDLEVLVDNNEGREPVFLTVAAVDEGILRLTKHQSPDPRDHFFGKKRLAVEIRDDYGRVLNPNLGAPLRFGGDQIGGEGLTVVPTKTVALFNGQIELDERGRGVVPLQIPEFNGELRLMAVAWSERKLGSVAQALTVRERTPTLLSLPRFLAPGDKAKASLFLDNLEGDPGVYNVALKGRNSVLADDNVTRDLTNGEQLNQELQIEGGPTGIGQVDLVVTAPGGESNTRSVPIQSRSPFFPISRSSTTRLAAGDSLSLSPDLFSGFSENTVEAFVSFSPFKGVDPAPLIASLSEYPYGCSEQLVSVAMPLMYKNVLSQSVGADERDLSVRQRVQTAINTLLDRQDRDGSFGLWRVSDRAADPWIGAYITDFLTRASAEGFAVPDQSLERSFDALRQIADVDRYTAVAYRPRPYQGTWSNDTLEKYRHRAAAYAMYVLARAGEVDISDLRYFHDASIDKIESPLARAHLGAALATVGDRARAVNAFGKALQTLGYENTGDHYQSSLRDAAGVVSILAMIDGIPGIEEATETLEGLIKDPTRMNTQEKAFAVLAARSLLRYAGDVMISRNDGVTEASSGSVVTLSVNPTLEEQATFKNDGSGPIFATLHVSGLPTVSPGSYQNSFTLTKQLLAFDGTEIDPASVQQNDRMIVLLRGEAEEARINPAMIVDLLPAGVEIEAVLGPADVKDGPYKWIGSLSKFKIAEARDDRFVAAIDLSAEEFTAAYAVRATTPGAFTFPGAIIEDMYRPGIGARTIDRAMAISSSVQQ